MPVDPTTYDYARAARDALHFGKLLDRWFQNLPRTSDSRRRMMRLISVRSALGGGSGLAEGAPKARLALTAVGVAGTRRSAPRAP
jgi:hypothetical protein